MQNIGGTDDDIVPWDLRAIAPDQATDTDSEQFPLDSGLRWDEFFNDSVAHNISDTYAPLSGTDTFIQAVIDDRTVVGTAKTTAVDPCNSVNTDLFSEVNITANSPVSSTTSTATPLLPSASQLTTAPSPELPNEKPSFTQRSARRRISTDKSNSTSNGQQRTTQNTTKDLTRERNRLSATKFRRRTKSEITGFEKQEKELRLHNDNLSSQVTRLRDEIFGLKTKLLEHGECDNELIQGYIKREATRNVT